MLRLFISLLIATTAAAFADDAPAKPEPISITDLKRAKAVDFGTEIIPLFQKNCLACHNAKDAKGDLVLETPSTILKGGEDGPAVVPGKSAESLLLKVAAHLDKPFMPPKNNKADAKPLTPDELGLVKLWIDQGATGVVSVLPPLRWQNLAETFNPIQASAISSDGQFAACSRANHIDLYEIPTLEFAGSLDDPNLGAAADRDMVESLAFSPDGQLLAAGSYRNVKIWKLQNPTPRKLTNIPEASTARLIAFSPDAKKLALVSASNEVEILNTADGKLVWSPGFSRSGETNESANQIKAIALSASQIALVFNQKQIQLRNLSDTNTITFDSPAEIHAIAFHSNNLLLEAGADENIRVWNSTNGQKLREISTPARQLAVSADGKRIAVANDSAVVSLISFEDGKVIAELKGDRREQENAARAQRTLNFAKSEAAFRKSNVETSEKNQKAETEALKKVTEAKAAADKTLTEKNEAAKKANESKAALQKVLSDTVAAIAQANENKNLSQKLADTAEAQSKSAAANATEAAQIFERAKSDRDNAYADIINLSAAAKAAPDKTAEAHAAIDRALVIKLSFEHAQTAKASAEKSAAESAANAKLAAENKTKAEKTLADLTNQQKDADTKFKAAEKQFADADATVKKAEMAAKNVETNLQGTTAVAKKADEAVTETKKLLTGAEAAEKSAASALESANKKAAESEKKIVALTFAGPWLVASAEDSTLRYFSAETGHPGAVHKAFEKPVAHLASDGSSLITLSDSDLNAVDVAATWKLERQIGDSSDKSPLADRVLALDFSPDGKLLATGGGIPSRSGELKIWNVADGSPVREIKDAHSDTIFSVRFSPDQTHLASGGADKLMKAFEVASGKFIRSFEGHTHHVLNVSWMRHGRTLASAGADSAIKIWDFASGEQKKTITGVTREITAFQFLDGPAEALAASGDNQLRLLREDGGNVRTFSGASDYTQTAAITPDGKFLVAGGSDSQFRLWNGEKGDLIKTFAPPARATKSLATKSASK
jgi:WD40 repeat protein